MSVTVTLNVFSGRPNPTWVLSDEQVAGLRERLATGLKPQPLKSPGLGRGLGYRGLLISGQPASHLAPLSLYVHGGVIDPGQTEPSLVDNNRALERYLLETSGDALSPDVRNHVLQELVAPPQDFDLFLAPSGTITTASVAADAPAYNPGKWNVPSIQPYNNCYNYANDQTTNTFAQPGRAHGYQIGVPSCATVQPGAQQDGLAPCPNFTTPLPAGQGWYVALVIWPGNDYHWYRLDNTGGWSHKPGQTVVRNVDSSGHLISDPATCNRGPYTQFCGYLIAKKSDVIS